MKSARVMYGYAAFLALCGVLAFAIAWARTGEMQLTAILAPVVMGVLMVGCGLLASMYKTNHIAGMIGIHIGLVLPLLYSVMFARLAYARLTADEPTYYLVGIFTAMLIASVITLIRLLMMRPKPADRK
jgi:hypothetical protein